MAVCVCVCECVCDCLYEERHPTGYKAGSGVHASTQDVRQISVTVVVILIHTMPSLHLRERLLHTLRLVPNMDDVIFVHLTVEECLARDGLRESTIVWPLHREGG